MANYNPQSPQRPNSLNANAQSFVPSPTASKATLNAEPGFEFPKAKLETIPESPGIAALKQHKSFTPKTPQKHPQKQQQPQQHTQNPPFVPTPTFPLPLNLPPFYPNPNDTLALIPAIDQNGLLVMIPPSLATPGSLFTPILPPQPPLHDDNNENLYNSMEIDHNDTDDKYKTIRQQANSIEQQYDDKNIQSLPKSSTKKYSNTFLLRSRKVLSVGEQPQPKPDLDILNNIPDELQFLTQKQKPFGLKAPNAPQSQFDSFANLNHLPIPVPVPSMLGLNGLNLIPQPPPIADMQSLLFMNNFAAPFPMSYPFNMALCNAATTTTAACVDAESSTSTHQQVLGSKVVYLVEDGNKANRGFAQYSRTPTPATSPNPKRCKQSLNGMKFERRRNKEVHECFKDNPDLFAFGGYDSVMQKVTYQIPQNNSHSELDEGQEAVKLISGILNKLTPQNNKRLLGVVLYKLRVTSLNTLCVVAEAFHSRIIMQKPLVRMYCNFLFALKLSVEHNSLLGIIVDLIWKQIDSQYEIHETFCVRRSKIEQYLGVEALSESMGEIYYDRQDLNDLTEEYNAWLEGLYGNYVLLVELFINTSCTLFEYGRFHAILCDLIASNKEWTWNILYIVLIFHGVALQKLYTKELEQYLESIDELIDGIHYNKEDNNKYRHIPLRIKYLLMDVQEHIETKNACHLKGFMQPQKLHDIHAEFCKENNMTQQQLRKLLSLSNIEYSHHNNNNQRENNNNRNNNYHQRRYTNQYQCHNEYPWHTPPRFQRMKQQQRKEKQQLLLKQQQQHSLQKHEKQTNKMKKRTNKIKKQSGPLYLRNSHVPAPPNRCPPTPPSPSHKPQMKPIKNSPKKSKVMQSVAKPIKKVKVTQNVPKVKVVQNVAKPIKKTHVAKKKRVVEKKKVANKNDGWSKVKRNNRSISCVSVNNNNVIKKISHKPAKKQKKHHNTHHGTDDDDDDRKKADIIGRKSIKIKKNVKSPKCQPIKKKAVDIETVDIIKQTKSQNKKKTQIQTETETETEIVDIVKPKKSQNKKKTQIQTQTETETETVDTVKPKKSKNKKKTQIQTETETVDIVKPKKCKNKKKKKKKKPKKKVREKKKKKKKKETTPILHNDDIDNEQSEHDHDEVDDVDDDEKECETIDYQSSDDEIWCETTEESGNSDDVPAFLFGPEDDTENLDDLETALFCQYYDESGGGIDVFDMDNYTEDIDIFDDDEGDDIKTITIFEPNYEEEIISIISRYLETGNEEESFLYLHKHRDSEQKEDLFVSVCIKLYVTYGLLDNVKSQHDICEIERLFVRQMFYNNTLQEENYMNACKMLSECYFDEILDTTPKALHSLAKILVLLIENKILTLTQIANALIDTQCNKAYDISYGIVKHLIHSTQAYVSKLKALVDQVKIIRFENNRMIDLKSIFQQLQIDYSALI